MLTTIAEALRDATQRLGSVSDSPRLDAELLMAEALGTTRSDLLLRHTRDPAPEAFSALVERRERHEPIAYILGRQEFYGLDLEVNPSVLIPRGDSEAVIEAAREAFADRSPRRVLDLGTGSGALLLAALTIWQEAEGMGIDRDPDTLFTAVRNADRVGINKPPDPADIAEMNDRLLAAGIEVRPSAVGWTGRARFNCGDWRKRGWRKYLGRFDLILANPPYVEDAAALAPSVREWEPGGALFAGPDGLDDYRILIPHLPHLLAPGGVAVLEIGALQAEKVAAIAACNGFATALHRDLAGRPRALVLRVPRD